jgi:hypothetical protein
MVQRTRRTQTAERQGRGSETAEEELADLLSDPHCRYLLQYLRENDNPVSVSTLTRFVVAEITDTPADEVSDAVQRRVQTWLHHGQLPALDEMGVLEFDPESGTVWLTDDRPH